MGNTHKGEFSTGRMVNDLKTDVDFLLREASLGVETGTRYATRA
jgi:hypothetical protein